jgi:hypothetical protein
MPIKVSAPGGARTKTSAASPAVSRGRLVIEARTAAVKPCRAMRIRVASADVWIRRTTTASVVLVAGIAALVSY